VISKNTNALYGGQLRRKKGYKFRERNELLIIINMTSFLLEVFGNWEDGRDFKK